MIQVTFIDLLKQCNQSKKNAARNALSSSFSPYSPQPNEKVTINNDESKQEQDGTDNIQKFSSTHRNQSRISSSFSSRSLGIPSSQNYKDRLLSRNASFRVKKNKSALEDDLPEMRPGDVEKTYKLQPAIISSIPTQDMVAGGIKEEDEDEEDVGRSSSTLAQPFKLLANKIGLSRTLRMAPVDDDDVDYDEEMSRDVLEVAEVTGEIKIRFYVEKAEKEMTRAPRYHHHTPTSFTHIE
jgi:hypothetical protein